MPTPKPDERYQVHAAVCCLSSRSVAQLDGRHWWYSPCPDDTLQPWISWGHSFRMGTSRLQLLCWAFIEAGGMATLLCSSCCWSSWPAPPVSTVCLEHKLAFQAPHCVAAGWTAGLYLARSIEDDVTHSAGCHWFHWWCSVATTSCGRRLELILLWRSAAEFMCNMVGCLCRYCVTNQRGFF